MKAKTSMRDYTVYAPETLGVNVGRVEQLQSRLQHGIDTGPLPSVQFALARHGKLVANTTLVSADAEQCYSNTTRYNIFSCTKPVVAAAIWQLMAAGELEVQNPVANYLPDFGNNGKEAVTVEQVLCHTSGFPNAPMRAPQSFSSAGRLAQMHQWHLDWPPGSRFVYHSLSAHWVLVELIEQISGADYRDYIFDNIVAPLGLKDFRLGVPRDQQENIALLEHVGQPPSSEELAQVFGVSIDWPNTIDESLLRFNEPEVRELGVPGGGGISTAADMALFYQALMSKTQGLWDEQVLADATGTVRVNYADPITKAPANRGLGVVIAGSGKYLPYRGMGQNVGPRAFGHQGMGGQVAWGDPDSGLSFCLLTNGIDANPLRSAKLCGAASNRAGSCIN